MSEKITDRLRCRYAMGPFMPNGEPEFGWRDFSGPALEGMTLPTPIMLEAADVIAAKDAEIARLREALQGYVDAHAVPSTACKERTAYEKAVAALTQQEQGNV